MTIKGQRAVVLGGGIAGLAATAALARHFEEVVLVERDAYPGSPAVRPHAAHGEHAHLLLAGGLLALARFVPELPRWLEEVGLPEGDLTQHTRVAYDGRWLPRARSGVPIRPCTRADVEHLLLRKARTLDNVSLRESTLVLGLLGRERVRGVRLSRGGAEEELAADLVVDSMGRASPSARWLADAGSPPVEEICVDAGVVYASGWFEPPARIDDDWMLLATLPSVPRAPNMGILVRFGTGRILCSAVQYGHHRAPHTTADLVAHLEGLCVPELHRLLRASRAISPVIAYANTQNRLRRYGKQRSFPDGLVAIGDAVCSLNPRYGQGMTVAALGVDRLDRELSAFSAAHGGLGGFSHHFQRSLEQMLIVPWQMATMEDRSWASVFSGASPGLGPRLVQRGVERLLQTAFSDIDTYIRFMRVAHLLDSPLAMLDPRTLAKIAVGGGRGGRIQPARDAPSVGAAFAPE